MMMMMMGKSFITIEIRIGTCKVDGIHTGMSGWAHCSIGERGRG